MNCLAALIPVVYLAPYIPYFGDGLQVNDPQDTGSIYMFSPGAFGAAGTYHSGGLFK
jgi:hypothetical protein